MWKKVKEQINLEQDFIANETYPEAQLGKMGKTAMKILSLKDEEFYEGMGAYFVGLTKELGFFTFIEHLGRELRDFFLNLDNLHDYLKFKFPRMKPPSFFVEKEDESCKLEIFVIRDSFLTLTGQNTPLSAAILLIFCIPLYKVEIFQY